MQCDIAHYELAPSMQDADYM